MKMKRLKGFYLCAFAAILAGCAARAGAPGLPAAADAIRPSAVTNSSYKVIYRFNHGAFPYAGLLAVKGDLYGTTSGGSGANGTVFQMTTAGVTTTLYHFKGGSDGSHPQADLIDVNGTLYGTTYDGGSTTCAESDGCGTVFSVSASGTEKVLHAFAGGSDGAHPMGGLVAISGTLYDTTYLGGGGTCSVQGRERGCGTVFSLTTSGNEKVLHVFSTTSDGYFPEAGLIALRGALYGTTYLGGADSQGTVFRISTSGAEKVLYGFGAGDDGRNPQAPLTAAAGALYGTTRSGGGESSYGTVFSVLTNGTERVVHRFLNNPDGSVPEAGLTNVNGTLYGTTVAGGTSHLGTVFRITTSGKESVLHSFSGGEDGTNPRSAPIAVNGLLYGTTTSGGAATGHGFGTAFAVSP